LTLAKTAVDRAFELQPDLAEAHIALGYYFYHGLKDYVHALEQFSIALEKEPQDSEILSAIGYVQRRQGLFDLSLENQKKAFGMSPRDAQKAGIIARTYTFVRNYTEADNYMNLSISLVPDQVNSYLDKAVNYWLWKGDTDKAREALDNIPQRDSSLAVYHWILLELYERDYPAAQERISLSPVESFETEWYFISKAQLAGQVYDLMNQPEEANASYKTALAFLEEIAQKKPSDPRIHSSIGISKAGLGLKSNAIAEGKLGVELYPVLKDTLCGPTRVKDLALIYTMVGEYDAALDQIDHLLSIPSFMSVQLLNLDPRWDPLRDHPRFALIIEKYSE
jgi:serine/threonine-protein kinase